MAATKVLDHYRISLISDKSLFRVLSLIYKEDIEEEEDLEEKIDLSPKDLRLALTKLYRASLIKNRPNKGWMTTALAEEILSSLGISEVVSNAIVAEQRLKESDNVFLQACLSEPSSSNVSWSRDVSAVLRASKVAFKIASEAEPVDTRERTKTLYALIIGTNPSAKNLDIETFCDAVSNQYVAHHPSASRLLWSESKKLKDTLVKRSQDGVSDFRSSNHLLLTGESSSGKTAYLVTLARLIANAKAQRDTCELNFVYRMDKDVFSRAWECIARWHPSVERKSAEYFRYHLADAPEDVDFERLKTWLISELRQSSESDVQSERARLMAKVIPCVHEPRDEPIDTITNLKNEISRGALDSLSREDKQHVLDELASTLSAARKRFARPIDSGGK